MNIKNIEIEIKNKDNFEVNPFLGIPKEENYIYDYNMPCCVEFAQRKRLIGY